MFKEKEEKISKEIINSNNIIGKGSTFTGNIDIYGNLRVEGKIVGDVKSKSKVAVGASAIIEGNIFANVVEVEGEVKGSINVSELLTLKDKCKVIGNITAHKLVVDSGAQFEGKCRMDELLSNMEIKDRRDTSIKKAM